MEYDVILESFTARNGFIGKVGLKKDGTTLTAYNFETGEPVDTLEVPETFGTPEVEFDPKPYIDGLQASLDYINAYIADTTELTKLQILFLNEQAYENYKACGQRIQECEDLLNRINAATNKLQALESMGMR